jgi:hypothetical protein
MAIRAVSLTVASVNMCRGRFRLQLLISSTYCILFLALMATASKLAAPEHAALAVAIAEGAFYVVLDPIVMGLIFRLNGEHPVREIMRIFRTPIVCGGIAATIGWLAAQLVPPFHGQYFSRILVTTSIMATLYIPMVRKLAPQDWKEILSLRRSSPDD